MIDRRASRLAAAAVLGCVPALLVLATVSPLRAEANTAVPCTSVALVSAINAANAMLSGDTLDLAAGCTYDYLSPDNVTDGGNALPVIVAPITINGNGATITRDVGALTGFRIFEVATNGSLVLNNTTVSNGTALGNGGGILAAGGLTLNGATITGNTGSGVDQLPSAPGFTATNTAFTSNSQNGIFNQGSGVDSVIGGSASNNIGAGVLSNGPISINGATISGNSMGVVTVNGSPALAGITVVNSTLTANPAVQVLSSGATTVMGTVISGASSAAIRSSTNLTMDSDTISGVTGGFGIQVFVLATTTSLTNVSFTTASPGTALSVAAGTVTVTDSTFTKTGAPGGSGIVTQTTTTVTDTTVSGFTNGITLNGGTNTVAGTTVANSGAVGITSKITGGTTLDVSRSTIVNSNDGVINANTITASTIAGNQSLGVSKGGVASIVTDSILSNNGGANCALGVSDGGDNISFPATDVTCPGTFGSGDPRLDTLRDNGGPTQTLALLDGSAAAGLTPVGATGCTAPDTDQRGVPRLQNGAACDAGAFELDSTSTVVVPSRTALTADQTLSLAGVVTPFSAIPGAPSGTLSFFNNGALVATVTLSSGQAADGPITLPVGTYTVVATFPGARGYLASTSPPVTVTVSPPVPATGAGAGVPPLVPGLVIVGGLGLICAARRRGLRRNS